MSSPNVSWDIQDQNDRIISILAWVVVVVLVLYACVYFYKQARNVAERPLAAGEPRLAQGGTIGTPPALPVVAVNTSSPAPELALAGGDATRVVSHRPLVHPSASAAPLSAPPEPFGIKASPAATAAEPQPSALGYAVRIGKPHPSPQAATNALFSLPVAVQDVDFVQDGDSWVLQVGKFKNLDGAKALLRKLQPHISPAEIVALGEVKATASAKTSAKATASKPAGTRPAAAEKPAPKKAATASAGRDADAAAGTGAERADASERPARPAGKPAKANAKPAPDVAGRGVAEKRGRARADAAVTDDAGATGAPRSRSSRGAAQAAAEAGEAGAEAGEAGTEAASPVNSEEAAVTDAPDVRSVARRKSAAAGEDAGERGVVGAMTTGETGAESSSSGAGADEATVPRRKAAPARRRTTPPATDEASPAAATDTDDSGEVDAAPAVPPTRRPTARSRRTSAGTESGDVETAPSEDEPAASQRRSAAGVAQQVASAARERSSANQRYSLQVGAYSSEEKARAVASQLRSNGLAARVDESVTGETTVYRVRMGSFGDTKEAQSARRRVAGELGFADVRVIRD